MNYIDIGAVNEAELKMLRLREMSPNIPLSISTAMVFENEENANLKMWQEHLYVNMRTLLRNIITTCSHTQNTKLELLTYAFVLLEEIDAFKEIVKDKLGNKVTPIFYYPDYSQVGKSVLKGAVLRANQKTKAGEIWGIEEGVRQLLRQIKKEVKQDFFLETTHELPKGMRPSMVLTHYPVDLLSAKRFPVLYLLESHTGRIKKKSEWSSKLSGDEALLKRIPFCEFTLLVCGDGKMLFSQPLKIKSALRIMSEKDNWSTLTSPDKIRSSINRWPDKLIRDTLFQLL